MFPWFLGELVSNAVSLEQKYFMEKDIRLFIPKEHQILPESSIGTHYVAQTSLKLLVYEVCQLQS